MRSSAAIVSLALSLCAFPCLAQLRGQGLLSLSPECDGLDSLSVPLRNHELALRQAGIQWLTTPATAIEDLRRVLDERLHEDVFMVYAGHGLLDSRGRSALCFGGHRIAVADILEGLRSSPDHGVTLVLDACYSASPEVHDDLRPASVIGAALGSVTSKVEFAQAVADALGDVHLDENCDGLTTDQELFDAIERHLPIPPTAAARMYEPKPSLRRMHPRPVVLPIASRCEQATENQGAMEDLVQRLAPFVSGDTLEIVEDVRRQVKLARGESHVLPKGSHDYYCLSNAAPAESASLSRAVVTEVLQKAGLLRLPTQACAPEPRRRLSMFAMASFLYDVSIESGWVRMTRLGPSDWLVLCEPLDKPSLASSIRDSVKRPSTVSLP